MTTSTNANLSKFQDLLRELFQFDSADLDFGIYRVMNHKRDAIERFIVEDLPETVSAELVGGNQREQTRATENLEKLAQQIVTVLAPDALDPDGNLDPAYRNSILGQRYLEAQRRAEGARSRPVVEADVYNRLYAFFSRYYQDGDFISRRRYSRNQRYAIPYNGEEVYLHWANADQYYVKTAEHFRNYDWTAPNGVTVRFRVQDANIEQNNVKGDTRFFAPRPGDTHWDAGAGELTVPFDYRPLNGAEARRYGRSGNRQDKIVAAAASAIPNAAALTDAPDALEALTGEYRRNGNGELITRLERHLRRYTRRNDSDFFIHKDLRGFLNRELDFYLKNEVLNLDEISAAGPDMAQGWFQEMRVIKTVGAQIIDFVAQIEDFQKRLWEKRKFVTDVQYCVTLANVPADFYPEIAANAAQWNEWQTLFGIDGSDRSPAFLNAHPTLPLDTAHFSADFTDRLLASFNDLDGMTDGLLIASENWQVLNLLGEKYRGGVDCIYIDPPYNTNASAIIYKNGYRNSSWLAMISNRIEKSGQLLAQRGVLEVAIDDTEMHYLRSYLDSYFGQQNRVASIVAQVNPAGQNIRQNMPALSHDYCYVYTPNIEETRMFTRKLTDTEKEKFPETDAQGPYLWDNLRRRGGNSRPSDRPGQWFPLFIKGDTVRVPRMDWDTNDGQWLVRETPSDDETEVWPIDPRGEERIWRVNPDGAVREIDNGTISVITKAKRREIVKKSYMPSGRKPKTVWVEGQYSATTYGTKLLNDILGEQIFSYPKSVHLVADCLRFWTANDSMVMDYFAGSGTTAHAVINLNREDGGQRKFILVEMGEYFDTVLLPRVKKVTYTPEWVNGQPKREPTPEESENSPRIVKYVRLESYEDALDGIAFDESSSQLAMDSFGTEYLLKYMLKWETKESRTLLNVRDLTAPFSYILRARSNGADRDLKADVPETFNYLIGLNVRKRETHRDGDNRYLVFRGETRESPGKTVVAVWRETSSWGREEFARDREFVKERGWDGADTLYVNGGSCIPNAMPVEPLFKSRMFAPISAAT